MVFVAAGGAGCLASPPPGPLEVHPSAALLSNVTVIEPGVARRSGQTIEIDGDRIVAVRDSRPDEVAASGFALPGLIDMHVHHATSFGGLDEYASLLFLAHGVTSVRNTGDFDASGRDLEMRDATASGRYPGPRVFRCGPILDGLEPLWPDSRVVTTPAEARSAVARLASEGVDCIKVYVRLEPAVLAAIRASAREAGLPVLGHVPRDMTVETAELDDVQHLTGVPLAQRELPRDLTDSTPAEAVNPFIAGWDEVDDARIAEVARASSDRRMAHTPTLVFLDRASRSDLREELLSDPSASLLPRIFRDVFWNEPARLRTGGRTTAQTWPAFRAAFARQVATVGALHRAGVAIHAGTDAGNPFVVPGASLHTELQLLGAAGLTPEEAWAAATTIPGASLPEAALGKLQPGAPADLLIFREDPTRDLAALSTLELVIARGRVYRAEALRREVARQQEHYHGWIWEALARIASWFAS